MYVCLCYVVHLFYVVLCTISDCPIKEFHSAKANTRSLPEWAVGNIQLSELHFDMKENQSRNNPPKTSTQTVLNGLSCVFLAFCTIKSWVSIVQMERSSSEWEQIHFKWAGVICECSHGRLTGFNRRLLNVRVQEHTGIKWSSSITLQWSLWLALWAKYNFLFLKVMDNKAFELNWTDLNGMDQNVI